MVVPRSRAVMVVPRPRSVMVGPRPRAVIVGPRPRAVMVDPRPRAGMVGPRPRVLLTLPLAGVIGCKCVRHQSVTVLSPSARLAQINPHRHYKSASEIKSPFLLGVRINEVT